MAKIILIAEKVTPTSWQLALALRSHQHNVTFLTSAHENIPSSEHIEVMAYFKKWSWAEGFKILPLLLGMNPQIIHFVLDEDRMSPAQILLSAFSKAHPSCVLTSTILHIQNGLTRRNPVRYLLQESDIVTCPSVEVLAQLRGLDIRSTRQGRGILPPVLDFSEELKSATTSNEISEIQSVLQNKKYVVIPFSERKFEPSKASFKRMALIATHFHIVLLGSMDSWPLRQRKMFANWMHSRGLNHQWTLTGNLRLGEMQTLLSKSEAFILAGQQLTPLEMTEYYLRSIQTGTTPILDSNQSTLHASIWQNGKNCWILPANDLTEKMQSLFSQKELHLEVDKDSNQHLSRDLIDAPLNELNRLYNKALSQKPNL